MADGGLHRELLQTPACQAARATSSHPPTAPLRSRPPRRLAWGPAAAALQQLRPGAGEDADPRRRQLLQQRLALDPLRAALTVCHWPEACALVAPGSSSAAEDGATGDDGGSSSSGGSGGGQLAQLPGCAAAYDPAFLLPFAACCLRRQLLAPRAFVEAGLLSGACCCVQCYILACGSACFPR